MSEIAEADESAAQNRESLVDVLPPLVAYAKNRHLRGGEDPLLKKEREGVAMDERKGLLN